MCWWDGCWWRLFVAGLALVLRLVTVLIDGGADAGDNGGCGDVVLVARGDAVFGGAVAIAVAVRPVVALTGVVIVFVFVAAASQYCSATVILANQPCWLWDQQSCVLPGLA